MSYGGAKRGTLCGGHMVVLDSSWLPFRLGVMRVTNGCPV